MLAIFLAAFMVAGVVRLYMRCDNSNMPWLHKPMLAAQDYL